jgi:DNA-binding response OmpR family regulator
MDIQMPVMDGIEATHEILDYEEDEEVPHVPIVALTANALKGDRERFLAEGMDEYITKPIETAELLYVLNKFLSDKAKTGSSQEQKSTPVQQQENKQSAPVANIQESETETAEPVQASQENDEHDTITVDEITIEDVMLHDTNDQEKKILVAKKFLLERRILTKVLDNLGYD